MKKKYITVTEDNRAFSKEGRPLEKDRQARAERLKQSAESREKRSEMSAKLTKKSKSIPAGSRSQNALSERIHNIKKRAREFKWSAKIPWASLKTEYRIRNAHCFVGVVVLSSKNIIIS